jgi:hypothetical protein
LLADSVRTGKSKFIGFIGFDCSTFRLSESIFNNLRKYRSENPVKNATRKKVPILSILTPGSIFHDKKIDTIIAKVPPMIGLR